MEFTRVFIDQLTYKIIGCAIEIHRHVGPGLLESVYHTCFKKELELRALRFRSQLVVPVLYKGMVLNAEYRLDLLVEDLIIVEIKALDGVLPVHKSQLLTYMKLLHKPKGILINFNCMNIFKEGQYTLVNELYAQLPF